MLEVLDSWGKPESGILDGNIVFEGRYFECLNARFANSSSQYCDLYVTIPSSLVSITSRIKICKRRIKRLTAQQVVLI